MKSEKQLFVNFIATMIAFAVNALINFVLSSYIVNTIGEDAYGFIQLANTFISYFMVITLAINSMASRFISLEFYKSNVEEANEYYSATFWANFIITLVFLPLLLIFIMNIEHLINIPVHLISDVRNLFIFLTLNLFLGLLTTNLSVSYYIKNKLYVQSIINMFSYILKAIILYFLYIKFPPYVAFVGLTTLIATIFIQAWGLYYKKKFIPEIKIKKCNFEKIKILTMSGIWNSITRIGTILSEGLDLFLANLFLSPSSMGILAIVKIIPNIIGSVLNTLVNIFIPNMVKVYAQETKEEFVKLVKEAMAFVGVFLNIPIVCLIVFGIPLFRLWMPTQNANLLYILSVISISHWIIIGPASIIHNVFTVTNKIKTNSLLVLLTGVLNFGIVYVLLKTTSLDLYAITGVSCILSIARNLIYTLPWGGKYINCKWTIFFPELGKSLMAVLINIGIGGIINMFLAPSNYIGLIISFLLLCLISLAINCIVMLGISKTKDMLSEFIKVVRRKHHG